MSGTSDYKAPTQQPAGGNGHQPAAAPTQVLRVLDLPDEHIERFEVAQLVVVNREVTALVEALLRKKTVVDLALERHHKQILQKIEMEERQAQEHARQAEAAREYLKKMFG